MLFHKDYCLEVRQFGGEKSKLLPVLPHVSDGLTETGVRLYSVLLQLCREPRVQFRVLTARMHELV
jgi:hypothetical protein